MEGKKRLTSLDFFRGFTMLLLISGGALQYFARPEFQGTVVYVIFTQFTHPEWEGFRFWDLIQPFFMFIVGVAIPFSVGKRLSKGDSWSKLTYHAGRRSLILIFLGVTLMAQQNEFSLSFQNVLAQIGFTYFIAFILIRTKPSIQFATSIGLIVLTAILYRLFPLEGNDPFAIGQTFGDRINHIIAPGSRGNWASFNAIPTAAHTIWGSLCGQLLLSKSVNTKKLQILIIGGFTALIIGYAITPISPIIKRICTSSFVFVSGGWTILAFALMYWIIDIKNYKRWAFFGVVVGMNPIFIYLLGGSIRNITYKFLEPWTNLIFSWTSHHFIELFLILIAWFINWYICYYLFKKRIFIKI